MLKINHVPAGFFSNCSVYLEQIIFYYNNHKQLPNSIDATNMFHLHKPSRFENVDLFSHYFHINPEIVINLEENIDYTNDYQYNNYKSLDKNIYLFIEKYFNPTPEINSIMQTIEDKYNIRDYNNICCLFYRGNDKITETQLCSYDEFIERGKKIEAENPNTLFLIQSDETEFIQRMSQEFKNSFHFKEEIRHMSKCMSSVEHRSSTRDENYQFAKYYLAITLIMAKCKDIICISGNCSIWIAFFRKHAEGIQQYINGIWG